MSNPLFQNGAGWPRLEGFVSPTQLRELIARAREEDLGPRGVDVTSEQLVPAGHSCEAVVRARQPGRLAGVALLAAIVEVYNAALRGSPPVEVRGGAQDGQAVEMGGVVARLTGSMRGVLAVERVALNFLTHLSGVATLTHRFVQAVAGTRAKIYDTRKTLPGLRALEKYAVACGGGHNHRFGLYDAVLVKDNHIAQVAPGQLGQALQELVKKVGGLSPPPAFIEVEVDSLDQLERVLEDVPAGIDVVLLDNMPLDQIQEAVEIRYLLAPHVQLEASGGVTLQNVRQIALTGVDRISVGAITHSAPALDLGLDIV